MAACALAVMAPLALAACGSSDKKGKETTLSVSEVEQGNNISIKGVPATIPAGPVTITLTNSSKDGHDLQLAKIDGNHSQAEVIKLVGGNNSGPTKIPSWLHAAGGVGEANAGSSQTSVQVLQPGTYYAIDDDSPGGGGGPSNAPSFATRGAITKFTVTGSKVKNDLPKQETTITAKKKGKDKFEFVTDGIKGDKVQFVNTSNELHHVIAFKIGNGKTAADVKKFLASNGPPTGPPPFDTSPGVGGGTAVIDKDGKVNTNISFKQPGQYVLVCFLTDRDGKGKPHFKEGLFKEVSVK